MTQDENKIYQIIYTGEEESDKNTKPPIEWTFEELRNAVMNSKCINEYYTDDTDTFKFITNTKTDKLCDGDRVEKWRTCKSSDAICQMNGIDETKYEIQASDFGRVRLRLKNNKDKWNVCPLYEEYDKTHDKLNYVLENLIERHKKGEKVKIGYLIAKIPGTEHFLDLHVYRLVADAWLENYECYKSIGVIHHITNDGYYNRPENLVFLSDWHSFIHNGNKGQSEKYNPKESLNRSIS